MNTAVKTAKKKQQEVDVVRTLSTGVRALVRPVSARLITETISSVPKPAIPMWHDPDRDRDVPNPDDPTYIRALEERQEQQGVASFDAMVMFGIELVDGVPDDDGWIKRLRLMEKLGHLDLSDFDLDDELEREFAYKRYVAVSAADMDLLQSASGVTEEEIAIATESFPSD